MTSVIGRRVKGRNDEVEVTVSSEPESIKAEAAGSDPAEAETEVEAEKPQRAKRWSGLVLGLAALVLISGVAAWFMSSNDDELESSRVRDVVLLEARHHIETLNTLDYTKVDQGLKAWTSVTTGTLNDQLNAIGPEDRKLLEDQKKISTGKVVDAAVINLDGRTATVIAAVEVTVKDAADKSADPVVKRNRFSADLTLVKGDWKLENLQQVAVNLS